MAGWCLPASSSWLFCLFLPGIVAIGFINEALDEGDPKKTLQALQTPAAKLEGVTPKVAQHYQDVLLRTKREKAQVRGKPVASALAQEEAKRRPQGLGAGVAAGGGDTPCVQRGSLAAAAAAEPVAGRATPVGWPTHGCCIV